MTRRFVLLMAGLMLIFCAVARGQPAQVELRRFQRQLEQIQRQTRLFAPPDVPAGQRALIDYGGIVTFNFLSIDDTNQETHILRQSTLNAYARVSLDGVHEFFARGRASYVDFNAGDAFDEHGDDLVEPTLDRAHYRFDLKRYIEAYEGRTIDGNLIVQGGRQLVHWANGLTLSQEIDGGQVTIGIGSVLLQTVAGITRDSATDFDSSRPDFSDDTKRGFFGGLLSFQVSPKHKPYVYGLVQEDFNGDEVLVTDLRNTPTIPLDDVRTEFDYNSYYIGAGSSGSIGDRLLYGVELVYEAGEGLSNSFNPTTGAQVAQSRDDIRAYAADVRLDYLLTDPNRTRLSGEMIIATGDTDRLTTNSTFGGNRSGTKDRAFNAFGLVNTGLAFSPTVSNLLLFRGGASTFPLPASEMLRRLQVGTNTFLLFKLEDDAPIEESTRDRSYLGFEADFFANWQVTSDLSLTMRYGVFFPGSAIATDHDARHLLFTGVTLAF